MATRLLLRVNALVWIYVLWLSSRPSELAAFYERWSFDLGALLGGASSGPPAPALVATLITHQLIHAGWLHVLGNLLYLWIFGDNVEDRLGSLPFLGFYLACGIVAAIVQGIVSPGPLVGAS